MEQLHRRLRDKRKLHAVPKGAAPAQGGVCDTGATPLTPQEFYAEVTERPDIRDLLKRLAR